MKLLRDASADDIQELKMRLSKLREERRIEQDMREVVNIVNRRHITKGEPRCQVGMMW